jgi:uncharacterized membrane protein YtjA (UPF0391 family)
MSFDGYCRQRCHSHKKRETIATIPFARNWHDDCSLTVIRKDPWSSFSTEEGAIMLSWALTFFIIALIAGIFGLAGVAGAATNIAWILFLVFLILFVISFVTGRGVPPI